MKRKVIQIAGSTQLVSLPRAWALAHGIKKGDELEVDPQGNKVIISADKSASAFKTTEIDVTPVVPVLQRVLHALYKKGYDEVIVKYSAPETLQTVQHMLHNEIIGYEIVEQKADSCIIRAVAGGVDKEFDPILRRTFLLLKSMLEGIVEAIDKGDASRIPTLRAMESSNNKYTGFCRRLINKGGYGDYSKTALTYTLVEELEKIADECKYLCDYLSSSKNNIKKVNKKIKILYKDLFELFNGCYELYYTPDIKKTVAFLGKRKDIVAETQAFFARPCAQSRLAHYLLTMAQQMANVLSFEMELNL